MKPDQRSLGTVTLVLAGCAAVTWFLPVQNATLTGASLMLSVLAFVCMLLWLMMPLELKGDAPDLLSTRFASYYEQDGLCFAPLLEATTENCRFHVYYQNRFTGSASVTLCAIPMEGVSRSADQPHEVPPVVVQLECAGGEVGVISVPYAVARSWQGKLMIYEIFAKVRYPNGRGDLIRAHEGLPVTEPSSEMAEIFTTAAWLLMGHIRITSTASIEVRLPEGVPDTVPADESPSRDILWRIDEMVPAKTEQV